MRRWVKLSMFLSSFSPLFFILVMQNINYSYIAKVHVSIKTLEFSHWDNFHLLFMNYSLSIILLMLSILPNIILLLLFRRSRHKVAWSIQVSSVSSKNGDLLNYIVAYILPFFAFKTDDPIEPSS